jgi:hypothetical protein
MIMAAGSTNGLVLTKEPDGDPVLSGDNSLKDGD